MPLFDGMIIYGKPFLNLVDFRFSRKEVVCPGNGRRIFGSKEDYNRCVETAKFVSARFTLSIPPESPDETVSVLQLAEQTGYHGVWIPDSHLLWRESYTSIAYYATQTKRLGLGLAVTNILTRHPSVIASAAATLNEISGGRFMLGIGSGATGVGTVGLRRASLPRLESAVMEIRDLLSGKTVKVDSAGDEPLKGKEYLPKSEMRIRWKTSPPPIFLSAHGPLALRLSGRIADGVIFSLGALPDMVRFANTQISRGVADAGRDPQKVQRWCRVPLAIGEDRKKLYEEVRPYVATIETNLAFLGSSVNVSSSLRSEVTRTLEKYDIGEHIQKEAGHAHWVSDKAVEELAIVGTPDDCLNRLEELQKAGATNFNLVIFTARDKKKLIRRFHGEVMSRLH